jgi:hypothetical protein
MAKGRNTKKLSYGVHIKYRYDDLSPLTSGRRSEPPSMIENLEKIIDASVAHELLMSELYMVFHHLFPMDSSFWWGMVVEEKSHASFIENFGRILSDMGDVAEEVYLQHFAMLQSSNIFLKERIVDFRNTPPSREEAFSTALEIEGAQSEYRFQQAMMKQYPGEIIRMLQMINRKIGRAHV